MYNQPGDLVFVVRELERATTGTPPPGGAFLKGLVYLPDLVLAGQSDGADTVAALMYDRSQVLTDLSLPVRPKAVALLSGAEWDRTGVDSYGSLPHGSPPALVVQSLTDACNEPVDSTDLYNALSGEKWFLALDSATHLGPYSGADAAAPAVERATTAFFGLALGRRLSSAAALSAAGNVPGIATLSAAPTQPTPQWASAPPGVEPCEATGS